MIRFVPLFHLFLRKPRMKAAPSVIATSRPPPCCRNFARRGLNPSWCVKPVFVMKTVAITPNTLYDFAMRARSTVLKQTKLSFSTHMMVPVATRRSEEHTSELQSLMRISYAVFCLKKKRYKKTQQHQRQK